MLTRFSLLSWLLIFLLCFISTTSAQTQHIIHFENSDHELHVYKIIGEQPGKTLLIIGGMHNEPGGYVTADLFADVRLKKGNLIVVPRANMPAIVNNKRGINGDMNRTFIDKAGHNHEHIYEDDIVAILKTLIGESDALLNLHDGYGYYRPEWESELANPKRWGQAIITDRHEFAPHNSDKLLQLGKRAQSVVDKVNQMVDDPFHRFHYKNTRTKDSSSIHKEQRRSATFYALYEQGIESYGVETSKNIRSLDLKVTYQTMIVNAFLDEFGIVTEHQVQKLPQPKLSYLLISINDERPTAYKNGEVLNVNIGDTVRIEEALTNYERGVIVDIENNDRLNDIDKTYVVKQSSSVRVLKDQYLAGRIYINAQNSAVATNTIVDNATTTIPQSTPELAHLLIELNGKAQKVELGGSIELNADDTLKLVSYQAQAAQLQPSQINFIGFVGNRHSNDGEDRGYEITRAKLLKRFSINGLGKTYQIKAEQGKQTIAQFYVNVAALKGK
jgi:predicted deacylase